MMATRALAALLLGLFIVATPAQAQWDVESDPVAFALKGYSAHLGYRFDVFRVSIGTFGADIPEVFHGNEGWSARATGVGAKIEWAGTGRGLFAGIEANRSRTRFTLLETAERTARSGSSSGVRVGYRIEFGRAGLYVAPWLGLLYSFGERGVTVADRTFDEKAVLLFPTVHVGWRF